jgi:hypothetical protein
MPSSGGPRGKKDSRGGAITEKPRIRKAIKNGRNGLCLAAAVTVADTLFARMKGLLGRKSLPPGEAMWIKPCNWVHTLGMRFHLDLVFLDAGNTVAKTVEGIPPNRLSPFVPRARSVLELPAGTVSLTDTRAGDFIEFA